MAENYIKSNLEFYDVINAFPIIKNSLEKLDFDVCEIKEGMSIRNFLEQKSLSEDEIDIFIKKLNNEINYFLKNGNLPISNTRLGVDTSKYIESEEINQEEE